MHGAALSVALLAFLATVITDGASTVNNPIDWCACCTCQTNQTRIIHLNCSRRSLTHLITDWPESLTKADNITNKNLLVSFNGNNISTVTKLPAIRANRVAIILNRCQISNIENGAFASVKNMHFLDLSENQITGDSIRANIFRVTFNMTEYRPIDLETLHLGHNKIHSLDRRLFENTPHLHTLGLNNNPLRILDRVTVMAISSAFELQILDLSYTDIDHIPDDMFKSLKKLQQLDLSSNRFLDIPDSLAFLGTSLQYLTFNNNPIQRLDSDSFLGLSKLEQLEIIQSENLTRVDADTFSQMKSLKSLRLRDNPNLCYVDSLAFGSLLNDWPIQEILLNNNNLDELSINLIPWKLVHTITLADNPWHCNCALKNIFKNKEIQIQDKPTCMSPLRLSGVLLTELPDENCKSMGDSDDFVSFKRGKMIVTLPRISTVLIGMGFVTLIAIIGVIIGILGGYVKNRLKLQIMFKPIRYQNINTI